MRPTRLDGYVGQDDVVGEKTLLRKLINSEYMPSIILWGPPGCGKVGMKYSFFHFSGCFTIHARVLDGSKCC